MGQQPEHASPATSPCESDRYGYRFEATPNREPGLTFPVRQPDGSRREVDIRTLPFVRFEDNESHCDGCTASTSARGSIASAPTPGTRSWSRT